MLVRRDCVDSTLGQVHGPSRTNSKFRPELHLEVRVTGSLPPTHRGQRPPGGSQLIDLARADGTLRPFLGLARRGNSCPLPLFGFNHLAADGQPGLRLVRVGDLGAVPHGTINVSKPTPPPRDDVVDLSNRTPRSMWRTMS